MSEHIENRAVKWKAVLAQVWVSCFVSFLFFRSTASSFWSERNRFFFHWQRSDIGGVFLAIVFVGFVFVLGYNLLRRFGKLGGWMAHFTFVAMAAFYLKVNLAEALMATTSFYVKMTFAEVLEQHLPCIFWMSIAMKAMVIICLALFIVRRKKVVNAMKTLCMILSPILCLYAAVLFSAREYPGNRLETPGAKQVYSGSVKPKKILFVIFDEWSYYRSFKDGSPMHSFPGLRYLSSRSVVFHDVMAPSSWTHRSIPSMLTGRGEMTSNILNIGEILEICNSHANIFSDMKKKNYRTMIYGYYLPYAALFKEDVDHCISKDIYKFAGMSMPGVALALILENITTRWGRLYEPIERPFYYLKHLFIVENTTCMHNGLKQEMSLRQPSFVFIHYQLPHEPFIYDRSGAKHDLSHVSQLGLEGYQGNLQFMDSLIEDLVRTMEASPLADDTMMILSSDHSWRIDPEQRNQGHGTRNLQHIPLLVHLPGQKERIDFNDSLSMWQFRSILADYLETDLSVESFMSICRNKNRERRNDE